MSDSDILTYNDQKLRHIESSPVLFSSIPHGAVVTLRRGRVAGTIISCDSDNGTFEIRSEVDSDRIITVHIDHISRITYKWSDHSKFSPKVAVMSASSATKAFGWIGGLVGAGVATTSVTVPKSVCGVSWGTTQTSFAAKMGMSVGSFALLTSWIGCGVGIAFTPLVYFIAKNRFANTVPTSVITVLNRSSEPVDVEVYELRNTTIAYTVFPPLPRSHTIYSFQNLETSLIDLPIPEKCTDSVILRVNTTTLLAKPLSIYVIDQDKSVSTVHGPGHHSTK